MSAENCASAEESSEARIAGIAAAADTTAAVVVTAFSKLALGEVPVQGMVAVLTAKVRALQGDDCGTLRRY